MCPALSAQRQTLEPAVGPAAHLAEVDCAVFSADVLFAFIVSWLGLRWDRLACQAEQSFHDQGSTFPHGRVPQWVTLVCGYVLWKTMQQQVLLFKVLHSGKGSAQSLKCDDLK